VTDAPIGAGTVLAGRYRLDDLLSESGGARLWRATDQMLARSVAVHVLDADDPRAGAILVAARTSATVNDGHFLRVLDAAEEDAAEAPGGSGGSPHRVAYVVHEWGSGMSLDRLLDEGPIPPRRAAWLVKEVADAVANAHRHGIAHGRLLPENVMVNEAGSVKLIGSVVDSVLAGRTSAREPGGEVLGDHESDVLNLAALLYAALVGRWPGTAGSSLPDAPRDNGRPLRPRQVRAGIPRSLDAICERVLNQEPRQHVTPIETAHEISAALSDYIGDPSAAAVTPEPTEVLQREALAGTGDSDTTQVAALPADLGRTQPVSASAHEDDGSDPDATTETNQHHDQAGDDSGRDADPEATQAGGLVFFDEDTEVGWVSPQGRGPRSDEERSQAPVSPPPPPPAPEPKPLFAADPPGGRRTTRSDPPVARGATRRGLPAGEQGHRSGPALWPWGDEGSGDGDRAGYWDRHRSRADHPDHPDHPDHRGDHRGGTGTTNGPTNGPITRRDTRQDRRGGGRWLWVAGVLALCAALLVAVVVAFNLGRTSGGPGPSARSPQATPTQSGSPAPRSGPVPIAEVTDFDPQADPPEENPGLADLAVDDDPTTAWETLTYYNNPQLGGLKDGVGLLVDLGEPTRVSEVDVQLQGTPTDVSLYVAPDGAKGAPTSIDGLDRVATADGAGEEVTLSAPQPVTTRYLVVWLTSLPPTEGGYSGSIAEIDVRS